MKDMICPRCKNEISDDAKFCTKCGEKIEKGQTGQDDLNFELHNKETLECPYCHTKLVGSAKFCVNCGHSINGDEYEDEQIKKKTPRNKFVIGGIVIIFIIIGVGIYIFGNGKKGIFFSEKEASEHNLESVSKSILAKQLEKDETNKDIKIREVETESATVNEEFRYDNENEQSSTDNNLTEKQKTIYDESEKESVSDSQKEEHHYDLVIADVSWSQAKELCEEQGAHLVTITAKEEYQIVSDMVRNASSDLMYVWVGGKVSGDMKWGDDGCWITGEKWDCDLTWYPGEPSYYDTDGTLEGCLCFWHVYYGEDDIGWTFNDQRNDLMSEVPSGAGKVGYICEYE